MENKAEKHNNFIPRCASHKLHGTLNIEEGSALIRIKKNLRISIIEKLANLLERPRNKFRPKTICRGCVAYVEKNYPECAKIRCKKKETAEGTLLKNKSRFVDVATMIDSVIIFDATKIK